jgi:hypothetical protein
MTGRRVTFENDHQGRLDSVGLGGQMNTYTLISTVVGVFLLLAAVVFVFRRQRVNSGQLAVFVLAFLALALPHATKIQWSPSGGFTIDVNPQIIGWFKPRLPCQITDTADPLPTVSKGNSATWSCPQVPKGKYSVVFRLTPELDPPIGAKVALGLKLIDGVDHKIELKQTNGERIDVNMQAGLPHTFESIGQQVELKGGASPVFELTVGSVADQCCWDKSQGNDAAVKIPKNVDISLTKVEPKT